MFVWMFFSGGLRRHQRDDLRLERCAPSQVRRPRSCCVLLQSCLGLRNQR